MAQSNFVKEFTAAQDKKKEKKTYIKVYVTKTMRFRARVEEPDKPPYEVTIGGNQWKQGKGSEYKNRILGLMKKKLAYLNKQATEVTKR